MENAFEGVLPIGTAAHGTLNDGSTTAKTFSAMGNQVRMRCDDAGGAKARFTIDGENPGTAATADACFDVTIPGDQDLVIPLGAMTDTIRINAIDGTITGLSIALERRVPMGLSKV